MRRSSRFLPLVLVAGLVGVLGAGCGAPTDGSMAAEEVAAVEGEVIDFDVQGMTCASCEVSIKLALRKVNGVVDASADAEAGSASARFDPARTNGAALAAAITRLGYPATVRAAAGGN